MGKKDTKKKYKKSKKVKKTESKTESEYESDSGSEEIELTTLGKILVFLEIYQITLLFTTLGDPDCKYVTKKEFKKEYGVKISDDIFILNSPSSGSWAYFIKVKSHEDPNVDKYPVFHMNLETFEIKKFASNFKKFIKELILETGKRYLFNEQPDPASLPAWKLMIRELKKFSKEKIKMDPPIITGADKYKFDIPALRSDWDSD